MLTGAKILITGPAGQIAQPICEALAKDNDVWGIARFSKSGSRERIEAMGATTRSIELGTDDFGDLPDDFDYVLHIAAHIAMGSLDYDAAIQVNGVGTALLLKHCRKAKAALVMSTTGVYKPHAEPMHPYHEEDPLGDSNLPSAPTYSISKIGEEVAARICSQLYDLPVVIARMNAAYGNNGGLPAHHLDAVIAGQSVKLRSNPNPYSPIHERDIIAQLPAILGAATSPATIVNWCGDEAVSAQQWCKFFGEVTGKEALLEVVDAPGSQLGVVADPARRLALTGPCMVDWRDGMREMVKARHPEALVA